MAITLILILSSVLTGLLGLMVLLNNPRANANRLFFLFVVSTLAWILTNLAATVSADPHQALVWSRLAVIGGVLLPYCMLWFTAYFPYRSRGLDRLLRLAALPPVVLILCAGTDLNVISSTAYGIEIVPGPLYTPLIVYIGAITAGTFLILQRKRRRATGKARGQLWYVTAGIIAMAVPGTLLSVVSPVIGAPAYAALGPATALGFVGFVAYAMLRHQLLDIRLVVARSVAYVLLLGTLAVLYGAAAFGAGELLFPGAATDSAQQALNVVLALVLALTFQPLRRFFEHQTDRVFYRDRYDTQDVLDSVGKTFATELRLERILDKTLETLCRRLKIAGGRFVVMNGTAIYQTAEHGDTGPRPTKPDLKRLNRAILLLDDLPGGERRRAMERVGARVSVTLKTKDRFVGYLLLGDKRSGDIYSEQDLRLLRIFAQEASIAIVNAMAYEEIARFNETLQEKVSEATARLKVANHNLRDLSRSKDEFISLASHQLRTPLTAIKGYLSMLEELEAENLTKDQRDYIHVALTSAQQMAAVVSDLLNVSRLAAGRFVLELGPVDLPALLREEATQSRPAAEQKGLALKTRIDGKIPTATLDRDKIAQVMMNFIDNAIYYTEQGSIEATLRMVDGRIRFTVTDTGIGVPLSAQRKLFKKFFRAPNAMQNRPSGTGLGLYLAKTVIEIQGGKVIFESTEGRGSTFGFELPLRAEPQGKVTVVDISPRPPRHAVTGRPRRTPATRKPRRG